MRRLSGSLFSLLLLLCSCSDKASQSSAIPYFNESGLTPLWVSSDSIDLVVPHRIGSFRLTDQNGKAVTEELMDNKITVVDFFFTSCPGICPTLSKNMARIQEQLADTSGILLLSYSVTPQADSVPVLKSYANAYGAIDGTWHLLTGDRGTIYDLARESYFANVDTGADAFLHTEYFYLIDGDRRIRGIYNGTLGTEVQNLLEDINQLKKESLEERTG